MLVRMSASEIQEWELFDRLEPFGAEVEELRFGGISSTLANLHLAGSGRTYGPRDFLVTFDPEYVSPTQDTDDMCKQLLSMFGG